jgi:hypothetical protein
VRVVDVVAVIVVRYVRDIRDVRVGDVDTIEVASAAIPTVSIAGAIPATMTPAPSAIPWIEGFTKAQRKPPKIDADRETSATKAYTEARTADPSD